ncbi:ABC transporter substrate-binding protein [Intrasporangium calvum]|uniref:ABC transporter substrate-binding protein n=1 Tax=Intrasporangium calvum TaxID=53358 RepID=A0ABT5GLY8_9MICO|nr:ABC transporter substrate-binding protein [Intrasporangium calvum]MDC5699197.1 ABC transporter substrate-binding protein [Intrasporangium calvum]
MSGIRKRVVLAGGMAIAMTFLAGCLQNPNPTGGAGGAGLGGFVDGGSPDGDKKVTILGAFGGGEQKAFEASLTAWEQESGIDIQYTADQDFTTTIKQKVNSGDSPDIGLFPQPGGLLEFAGQGKVQPIDTFLDYDGLDSTLIPGLLDSARYKGRVYAAPMRLAAKSFVWYPKQAYEAGGYNTEPKSIQELQKVADEIKADGIAPWCMGWESAQATGWVGTDWIEELVLRMWGPDVYDDWTSHRIPFNDERIVKSFDEFAKIAKDETMVLGGPKGVLSTAFGKAALPSFDKPPKCMMERQGNFVLSFYPKPVLEDLENQVGIFVYPPFEGGFEGQPMLGGADLAAVFNGNDEDVKKVMQFLTSDKFGAEWAKAGGWLSPHKTFDDSNYPDDITRAVAKFAAEADVFRFDGSDVMPKAVGSGTFWTEMVKWENGQSSKETADNIEASWPKS